VTEAAPFQLHPRLAADCAVLGDMHVSRLLLMRDRRFPWCILVPRVPELNELHQLDAALRPGLFDEIDAVSQALLARPSITRINVGVLGNLVPQLHVHVVGRHAGDAAWPGPVWGSGSAEPYPAPEIRALTAALNNTLDLQRI